MKTEKIWNSDETKLIFDFVTKNIHVINKQRFVSDEINQIDKKLLELSLELRKTARLIRAWKKERNFKIDNN